MPPICGATCCEYSDEETRRLLSVKRLSLKNNRYECEQCERIECNSLFDVNYRYHVICLEKKYLDFNISDIVYCRIQDFNPNNVRSFLNDPDARPMDKGSGPLNWHVYGDYRYRFFKYGQDNPPELPELPNGIEHQFIIIPCEWFNQMLNGEWHLHENIEVLEVGFSSDDLQYRLEMNVWIEHLREHLLTMPPGLRDDLLRGFDAIKSCNEYEYKYTYNDYLKIIKTDEPESGLRGKQL